MVQEQPRKQSKTLKRRQFQKKNKHRRTSWKYEEKQNNETKKKCKRSNGSKEMNLKIDAYKKPTRHTKQRRLSQTFGEPQSNLGINGKRKVLRQKLRHQ